MCYIIVKGFSDQGCIAYEVKDNEETSTIVLELESLINKEEKQVVVINNPEEWEEYEPYTIVSSREELIERALK